MKTVGDPRQKLLTKNQQTKIMLYLLKGYTLIEIAEIYGVSESKVIKQLKWQKEKDLRVVFVNLGSKTIPYYNDENDYGKIPQYSFDDLGNNEKCLIDERV